MYKINVEVFLVYYISFWKVELKLSFIENTKKNGKKNLLEQINFLYMIMK